MHCKNIVKDILEDKDKLFDYLKNYLDNKLTDEEISKILYYNKKIINLSKDLQFAEKLFSNYISNKYLSKTINCWFLHNLSKFSLDKYKTQIEESNNNSLKYLLSLQYFDKNVEYNNFIINQNTFFITNIPYFYKFIKHYLKNQNKKVLKIMLVNLLKLNDNYYHFLDFLNKYPNIFVQKILINKFNSKRKDNITHKLVYSLILKKNKISIKNGCKIIKYFFINNKNLFSKLNTKKNSSFFYAFNNDNNIFFEHFIKNLKNCLNKYRYKDNNGNGFIHYLKNKNQYIILTKSINSNYLIFCNNNKENALHTLLKKKYISFENKTRLIRLFVTLKINLYKTNISGEKPVDLIHPSIREVLEEDGIL